MAPANAEQPRAVLRYNADYPALPNPPRYSLRRGAEKMPRRLDTTSPDVVMQDAAVTAAERAALLRQQPLSLWFTGLSGAGKSALSGELSRRLHWQGRLNYVLDGDRLRHGLNGDLGFSAADRRENVRRIAQAAALLYDAGLIALTACISPFQSERDFARSLIPAGRFIEVFVDTPLALCEQRDTKGLYRRARRGEIANFTGIDSPYEPPTSPEIVISTAGRTVADCGAELMDYLQRRGLLQWPPVR